MNRECRSIDFQLLAFVFSLCPLCLNEISMQFEVEQKHRVPDVAALVARLAERGVRARAAGASRRISTLPIRAAILRRRMKRCGFARSATRVSSRTKGRSSMRRRRRGARSSCRWIRAMRDGSQFAELLAALGFKPVAVVRKRRRAFHIRCAMAGRLKGRSTKSTALARLSNWSCWPTRRVSTRRKHDHFEARGGTRSWADRSVAAIWKCCWKSSRRSAGELSFSPLAHFAILPRPP